MRDTNTVVLPPSGDNVISVEHV